MKLLCETFYGGSHKQFVDLLHSEYTDTDMIFLTPKKFHWRMRYKNHSFYSYICI